MIVNKFGKKLFALFFFLVFSLASIAPPARAEASKPKTVAAKAKERESVTHHQVVIDGRTISYTATAGTIILRDAKHEPTASIFFIAYTEDGVPDPARRPITFTYNGGPGSSSVWLQLGGVGPRRIETSDATFTPPPPYNLTDNPYSILDKTDLVFIDPVGTGYSHALGKSKDEDFWGVDPDVKSVDAFIKRYITKYERWNSPKFLLGESYGTTRSAALSYALQEDGVSLNGVMLVSSVLNFETIIFTPDNDIVSILYLPSYAAVAWYHHKLPGVASLDALLSEAESYAVGDYARALMKGNDISPAEEDAVAAKLSSLTGVSKEIWKETGLRMNNDEFEKELLHKEGKTTGRLDARFTGYSTEPILPFPTYDVQGEAVESAFTAAFNDYVRRDLGYKTDREYIILSDQAEPKWDWKHKQPGFTWDQFSGFPDVTPDLALAMVTNPHLQLMVNNGYFDLGTPFFATLYTMNHLDLPAPLRSNIHIYNYYSGHMIYLHTPSLKELHDNIDRFIDLAAPAK